MKQPRIQQVIAIYVYLYLKTMHVVGIVVYSTMMFTMMYISDALMISFNYFL